MSLKTSTLLLAYYGDDFTGSTDVMEALARAGLRTVLFLRPPTAKQLKKFPGLRAFGIAGGSRAMSPAQMERELPPAFKALKASGAAFIHYKTCSTFDSSPVVGSIGRAIELGRRVFGNRLTPLVVGAPVLGRYVVFGNLFARSGLDTEPSRLDRHPTMSRHPVTPMDEADIRLHLARQTKLPVELVDVLKIEAATFTTEERGHGERKKNSEFSPCPPSSVVNQPPPIVLLDTLREAHLPVIGQFISDHRPAVGQLFCAGSSGVEYALVAHWRNEKRIPATTQDKEHGVRRKNSDNSPCPPSSGVNQTIVVSGSCSPVTDRQIGRAVQDGFVEIACDSRRLADNQSLCAGVSDALERASQALEAGRSVIFQTARGSADARRAGFESAARNFRGATRTEKLAAAGESLGRGLAQILQQALQRTGAGRAVVCGGDTSTHVARELGIEALEFAAPVAPGAPLCRVHAPGHVADGCEIIFKGGQVGCDSFFLDLVKGGAK